MTSHTQMLPSLEAFLQLWDDPCEHVRIECEQTILEFQAAVVVDVEGLPPLIIKICPMRVGEA